jgi:hypothetical protein
VGVISPQGNTNNHKEHDSYDEENRVKSFEFVIHVPAAPNHNVREVRKISLES